MFETIKNYLLEQGLSQSTAETMTYIIAAVAILIISWLVNYIAKQFLLTTLSVFVKRSKTKWDDILLERKVFIRLSHLAPAMVIYYSASIFPFMENLIERFSIVYMMLAGMLVIFSFLDALGDIYQNFKISKEHPVKGYVQIIKIIFFVIIGIIAVATLMDQSPLLLLSGLGAMTAVLMLVFKDTILGLVASIQLSMNKMVQVGDWIEMPKFGADGDVIDISLHTIKVQNFDKTITTIPSYAMISDSFKNWRGMDESEGRRIKRAINIDIGSIKFCSPDMVERFSKYRLLKEYIKNKQVDIETFNKEFSGESDLLINGRNLTNVGTYRAYMAAYLKDHPDIHQGMTFLIRQLSPSPEGLPIEIYVFSSDQDWINYEAIQSDIFDHLLSVLPLFDLRVFQNPTGYDYHRA